MIDTIIVPQGAEYQAVKKGLNNSLEQQPVVISIPIGTKKIANTLTECNFWQCKPQRVLMMGLCGSLSTQYCVGDTVLYQDCYSKQEKNYLITDRYLNQLIVKKLNINPSELSISLVSGVTSDRIITTITEKQKLARKLPASVVDMETFAYLQFLQKQGIAVSILRIVSDDLRANIPNLEQAISDSGKIKKLAMAKQMFKQPITSLKFIRSSLRGLKKLEKVTLQLFQSY